jgi:hypothetical protein
MRKRRYLIPLAVLVIVVAIALAVLLRKAAPPEPVRLLPEAQVFLYVNVNPLRRADLKMAPVQFDPEYEKFVQETGFQWERDLDEAAFAVHVPQPGSATQENRYTEVFVAHFKGDKVRSYFNKVASRADSYRDLEIFNIPQDNRIVRLCILGPDMVAISNVDDPLVIRGIVDRFKRVALPFGGPTLVRQYYRKLPLGTVAWAIADIAHGSKENKAFVVPGGFDLFFPPDTVAIASVRYLGSIDFRAEFITASEQAAQRVGDQLGTFLALFRTLEANASGSDPDVKAFFDTVKVEQEGNAALLTATLPKGFLKKILTEPPPEPQPTISGPAPEKPKPQKHKRKK